MKRSLGKELIQGMKDILRFIKRGGKSDPSKPYDKNNLRVTTVTTQKKIRPRLKIKVKRK